MYRQSFLWYAIRPCITLCFAEDDEFVPLAEKAATEGLSGKQIKQLIQQSRPDYTRI